MKTCFDMKTIILVYTVESGCSRKNHEPSQRCLHSIPWNLWMCYLTQQMHFSTCDSRSWDMKNVLDDLPVEESHEITSVCVRVRTVKVGERLKGNTMLVVKMVEGAM